MADFILPIYEDNEILRFIHLKYRDLSSYSKKIKTISLCHWTTLIPIIEAISVKVKNSLQKVAGSLKTKIPSSTVPTAPIPVQTG